MLESNNCQNVHNQSTDKLEMRKAQNHWVQMHKPHIKYTVQKKKKNVLPVWSLKSRAHKDSGLLSWKEH